MEINTIVKGSPEIKDLPKLYNTVIIKPNFVDGVNVLTQELVSTENTKYVFRWSFDLQGATITIPAGCLLKFDGGSLYNGTIVCNDTTLVYDKELSEVLNVTLEGSYVHEISADNTTLVDNNGTLSVKDSGIGNDQLADNIIAKNKAYNSAAFSGLGRVYLPKNIVDGHNLLTQEMVYAANTIYVIQYDYELAEDITIPENCVLEFDGGSFSGGRIIFDNTMLAGHYRFSDMLSMTGSLCNKVLDTKNITFTSETTELHDLLRLEGVEKIVLKANHTYNINSREIDTQDRPGEPHYCFKIIGRNNYSVIGDNTTIHDNNTNEYYLDNQKNLYLFYFINCVSPSIFGITYIASGTVIDKIIDGQLKSPYGIRVFVCDNSCNIKASQLSVKNVATGFEIFPYVEDKSTINNVLAINTENTAYGCVLEPGVKDTNINIYSVGYHHRIIWMPNTKNITVNAVLKNVTTTASAFCISDYVLYEGSTEVCNLNNITINAYIDGFTSSMPFVIYGSRDTGDYAYFQTEKNIKLNIIQVAGSPIVIYDDTGSQYPYSGRVNLDIYFSSLVEGYNNETILRLSNYISSVLNDKVYNIKANISVADSAALKITFNDFDERSSVVINSANDIVLTTLVNSGSLLNKEKRPTFRINAPNVSMTQGVASGGGVNLLTSGDIKRSQGFNVVKVLKGTTMTSIDNDYSTIGSFLYLNLSESTNIMGAYFNVFGKNEVIPVKVNNASENQIRLRFLYLNDYPGNPSISIKPGGFCFLLMGNIQGQPFVSTANTFCGPNSYRGSAGEIGEVFFNTTTNKAEYYNGTSWRDNDGAVAGVNRNGLSSARPSGNDIYVGFEYFDTTLNKPIYWTGSVWIDATGQTV